MRTRKRIAWLFVICCVVTMLAGCRVGNTQFVWKTDKMNSHKYVFEVNDRACNLRQAKLYLCNYRNLYGSACGLDLWQYEDESAALEEYVKDVTLQEVFRIVCMNLLAEQMDMALTTEEQELAGKAAAEYFESLSEDEIAYMDIRESDIARAYREYALAKKLYDSLTYGIDEEVSDDEARVIIVQQIYVTDRADVAKIVEKLDAGDDFAAVANIYNRADEIERTVARDEFPQEVENIAFNLDNGAVSECIETEDGYYFIRCLSKLEEKLTEENKDNIRQKRRMAQFDAVYLAFMDSVRIEMNTPLWEEVSLEGTENFTTDSFFDIYTKYFENGEKVQ